MRTGKLRIAACTIAIGMVVLHTDITSLAVGTGNVLPSAGIDYTLGDQTASLKDLQEESRSQSPSPAKNSESGNRTYTPSPSVTAVPSAIPSPTAIRGEESKAGVKEEKEIKETVTASSDKPLKEKEKELEVKREEEGFKNLVIAKVNDYVNIRSIPSEEGEVLGKLYDKSVGNFIAEQNGWYKIQSGSVTGFVKSEYCVTGEAAVTLAKQVGTRIATVATTTLKVREQPGLDAVVLGMVPIEDELLVTEEMNGWVKVNVEEGDGYVSADYITLSTEFVQAESKEEEEKRLAKEAADRKAAQAAAAAQAAKNNAAAQKAAAPEVIYASGEGSALGKELANFACQFVGNPYKYGGTSLTNGADCSGFVMSVYQNYGVSLPHSSAADRNVGTAVDGLANAQAGDIVCYSGHVGIYIGGGQIVHASTSRTGIIISNASYRTVLSVRRIF